MRALPFYSLLVVFAVALFSCRKERSYENPTGQPVVIGQWQFSATSGSYNGPMDSAYIRTIGVANSLSLSGVSGDGKGIISLQVLSTGTIVKGDYKNPQVLFSYLQNGTTLFQTTSDDDFTISITSIDSASVSGTFSGIAMDSLGNKQSISSGKFIAPLVGIAPPAVGTGTLTVWSRQLCGGTGNIYVKVGDSVKAITQAFTSQPDCGAAGAASFALPAGAYTVLAGCGIDTLTVSAAVLPDVCSTLEVDLSLLANQDYFPLQSRWTYGAIENYEGDTLAIASTGDTTAAGIVYTKFSNDQTGETNYYRKDGAGNYYRYLVSAFGKALDAPVEIIMLKDNVAVNSNWETPSYQVTYSSGIPFTITAKLVNTIVPVDYSLLPANTPHANLIQVHSELWQQDPSGNWGDTNNGTTTIFAKGVGIIYYEDLNTGEDWQIRYYNVSF